MRLPGAPSGTNMLAPLMAQDLDVLPAALAWCGPIQPRIEATPLPE